MIPRTSVPATRILLVDGVALVSPGRTEVRELERIKRISE
jgi:hypothetical protein